MFMADLPLQVDVRVLDNAAMIFAAGAPARQVQVRVSLGP